MDEQLKLFDYEYTDLDYSEWKWVYYNENEHKYCEWCKQSLEELMSPNINELCIDCTGEAE